MTGPGAGRGGTAARAAAASGTPLGGAELEASVSTANVPTLLMVLAHLTGDRRWLADRYRPTRPKGLGDDDSGGLPDDVQYEIRKAAGTALAGYLAAGSPPPPVLAAGQLVQMMSFSVDEQVPAEYGPMMAADLNVESGPASVLPAPPAGLDAIIVGAGVQPDDPVGLVGRPGETDGIIG